MTSCQKIAEGEREVKDRDRERFVMILSCRKNEERWSVRDPGGFLRCDGLSADDMMHWWGTCVGLLLVVQESWVNGDGWRIIRNVLCYSHFPKGNLVGYYVDMCCKKPFISSRGAASGRDDGMHGVQYPHQCFVSFIGIQEQSVKMSFTPLSHWAGLCAVRLKHGHWSWSWPLRTTLVISFRCIRSHSPLGPAENMHLLYLWQRPHQAALHKLD